MKEQNYFSKKLVGGAINQRGIQYQIYICIKYIFDFLDDADFVAISIEQVDDFTIERKNEKILCQVKSTCYNMNKVKKFLDGHYDCKKILICSAFTQDVNNLIEKREWYENHIAQHDEEKLLNDYKNEIEKFKLDFKNFNRTKLETIPYEYAEKISKSAISDWAKKHKIPLNIEKLFDVLYHKISKLGSLRGTLLKDKVCEIINQCIDDENDIYTALDIMENKDSFNENGKPQEKQLYYIQGSEDYIFIPKLQYWDDILINKEPMYPLYFDKEPFKWDYPNFDIKVLNNTNKEIFLTEIVIEVLSSIPDPSPLIYINGNINDCNARQIELVNAGWGKIRNLKMKINCDTNCNENFSTFDAEEYIGDFATKKNVDLTKMLHKITKIDFDNFEKELNSGFDSNCENLLKKYFGKYSSGNAYLNGILDFDSDTLEYNNKHFIIKFSSWINLYKNILSGAYIESSQKYDIELPAEGSNYVKKSKISQGMKPGEMDRFSLKIKCAKSSKHLLNIYLQNISGKKIDVKKNVQLNICIPRLGNMD